MASSSGYGWARGAAAGPAEHAREDEDIEEQLEQRIDLMCKWLQVCNFLSKDHPAYATRISVHCLTNAAFIAEVVRCLCPVVHSRQLDVLGGATPALDVAASCLGSVFKAVHAVDIRADELVLAALQAGEAEFEPLSDIVLLWQHILTYAVCCESREKHIGGIRHMPADLQKELMQVIRDVEQRRAGPRGSGRGAGGQAPVRTPKCSISGAQSSAGDFEERSIPEAVCTPGADKDQEAGKEMIEALLRENSQLRLRACRLSERVEKDRHVLQRSTAVLDGEFESFEQSWNLEKQLREKDALIHELSQQVQGGRQAVEELQRLGDELQLARTREAEHATVKARLERCSQRLEEAGNLKLELQACGEKHAAACRERDALAQEVGQLKGTGHQLDAWKAKVRRLELQCSDADVRVRAAEAHARAAEAEQQRLAGEGGILEERLQDAELRLAVLREGGAGACGNGEILEPFTADLKERMQHLEDRNAALEEQVSAEGSERLAELVVEVENLRGLKDHFEQRYRDSERALEAAEGRIAEAAARQAALEQEHRNLGEQLQAAGSRAAGEGRRADAAEQELLEVSETCGQRGSELAEQRSLMSALEADLGNVRSDLRASQEDAAALSESLRQERQQAASSRDLCERYKTDLQSASEAVAQLRGDLDGTRASLLEVEQSNDESHTRLVAQDSQLQDIKRQCAALRGERAEAAAVMCERDRLLGSQQAMGEAGERLRSELSACQERAAHSDARLAEVESRLKHREEENEDLRTQLKHSLCEKSLHERRRAGVVESEEAWARRQADLLGRLDDLQQGLAAEVTYNSDLYGQLRGEELRSQRLEDLVRRFAPADFQTAGSATHLGWGVPGPQGEQAQLRAENRQLHAALSEQRLRGAGDSKQLAMTSAKLRHLEKVAEQARSSEQPLASADKAACDDGGEEATPTHVSAPVAASPPKDRATSRTATSDTKAPVPTVATNVPRSSILKKPKPPGGEAGGKENRPPDAHAGRKPHGVSHDGGGGLGQRRSGLIGGIGLSGA